MRNPMMLVLGGLVVLLLAGTGFLYQKYRQTAADFAATKASEESVQNRYSEAINSIAAIQDSLGAIVLTDTTGRISSGLDAEQKLTAARGDEALDRIAELKAGVERTKARIAQLESSLKKSGVKVSGLQKMIAGLKQSVADKEQQIGMLSVQVDSLETTVTGLSAEVQTNQQTIQAQQQTLEERRRELGTVYYVIGDKRHLTKAGVVVAQGGVLGVGKTLKPSGQFDSSVFTALDTDEQTVVSIPSAKAQVLSAQPPSSYQLQVTESKTIELRIIDPREFRKVKHLVIMTT